MIDQYYLLLVLPALLISLFAQFKVKSTFTKYSQEINSKGLSGAAAASLLLRANDITDVRIEPVAGELTDNYNPTSKVLHLSEPVLSKTTIAAVGVAAHETGHAIQHAKGYGPLALRSMLVPVANIGSSFGPTMAIAGLLFGFGLLIDLGIILYACAVLFYVVTLPVEFNASSRALVILRETNSMTEEELKKVKKVLSAAAMTYVASALTAIVSLLRLILISKNRRR